MKENFIHSVLNYLRDKLSNKERHTFEKEMNTDPFLQDAMDGFAQLSADELEFDINNLTQKINSKAENKNRKLIPYYRIAASIAIIIGIGITALYISNNNSYTLKLAEESNVIKQDKVEEKIIEKEPKQNLKEATVEDSKDKTKNKIIATPQAKPKSFENKASKVKQRKKEDVAKQSFSEQTIVLKEEYSGSYEEPIMAASPIVSASSETISDTIINIESHLQGKMAGVAISNNNINSGASNNVLIRGAGSIKDSSPLYVIDGVVAENIENISPENIESIEIIEDKQFSAIHGSRSSDGAVMLRTKKSSGKSSKNNRSNLIKGKVVDESDLPLPGANIIIAGTNKGVISDIDGYFTIEADSTDQLKVAYIGYEEIEITNKELKSMNYQIKLRANELALEEVMVVGYGTKKKSQATGAVSRISASDISPHNKQTPEYIKKHRPKTISITCKSNPDISAEPKDGTNKFKKYIKKNFKYESLKATKIVVSFFVETDGSISEIVVLESPNENYSNEIIRLINNYPAWLPSQIDSEEVRELITMTILFK